MPNPLAVDPTRSWRSVNIFRESKFVCSSSVRIARRLRCPLAAAPRLRWPRHGPRRRRPAATQWRRLRHILQDPKQRTEGREVQRKLEKLGSNSGNHVEPTSSSQRIATKLDPSLIKASCLEVISTQVAHAQLVHGLWHGIGKDLWQSKDSSSQSVRTALKKPVKSR